MSNAEQNAKWYAKNAPRIKAKLKARYEEDPTFRARKIKTANDNYVENKERRIEQNRKTSLNRKYGLTTEQYDAMVVAQDGLCLICKRTAYAVDPRRKNLCVDHDHTTQKVRGLLCGPCNSALGLFQDNSAVLFRAIEYLNTHKEH